MSTVYQIGTKVVIDTVDGRVTATITAIDYDEKGLYYTVRWPTADPGVHGNTCISPDEIIEVVKADRTANT